MGNILHANADYTRIRKATQGATASIAVIAKYYTLNPKTISHWKNTQPLNTCSSVSQEKVQHFVRNKKYQISIKNHQEKVMWYARLQLGRKMIDYFEKNPDSDLYLGHDNLSMYKNIVKYCYDNEKQICTSFKNFRA